MHLLKKVALVTLLATLATAAVDAADRWDTVSVTNPTAGQVLWDSGVSSLDTIHLVCLDVSTTVAATVLIQHRNAANTGNLEEFQIPIIANELRHACVGDGVLGFIELAPNERLRVVNNALALGLVSLSMQHLAY